jgi:protocatechuate 3,4-dioxygenase beta subunit
MRRYRLPAVSLILFTVLASAQGQPSSGSQPDQFKVEGVVVNALTGAPISRALVQLTSVFGKAVLTGPDGEFAFDKVPHGAQQIMVRKPGYFRPGENEKRPLSPIRVEVGPNAEKITLKLIPEAVISGEVTGTDDEPLEGAVVEVLSYRMAEGRQQLLPVRGNVRTDEDGGFRIAGLPPGRYYVAVKARNIARRMLGAQSLTKNETYPLVVYYPTATDAASAGEVDLHAGQQAEVQFSLKLQPGVKVAGVVKGPQNARVTSPLIVDDAGQVLAYPEEFDPMSGTFEFRSIPPGTYSIRAGGSDQDGHTFYAHRTIAVSRPVTDLKISILPGANIPVVVRTELSRPRQPGHCRYSVNGEEHESDCTDYPAARVELLALDDVHTRFYSNMLPNSGPMMVAGVTPGKYLAKATAMFGGYVQSFRCGVQDLLREPLMVPEGGAPCSLEVVVRDDYATVKLNVQAQDPQQQTTLLVFPDPALLPEPQLIINNAPQGYSAQLAPGNYKIYAFDAGEPLEYANPEVLAKYSGRAASVSVTANGVSNVNVELIRTGDSE